MNATRTKYKWQARAALVEHLRATLSQGCPTLTNLVERLTDLSRSGSLLASEAHAAIYDTTDSQFDRLLANVTREVA